VAGLGARSMTVALGIVHVGTVTTGQAADPVIPVTSVVVAATMADVEEVEVVVAHSERATLRVGDEFLKIDADQTRTDVGRHRRRLRH